jgi:hypothetical protein
VEDEFQSRYSLAACFIRTLLADIGSRREEVDTTSSDKRSTHYSQSGNFQMVKESLIYYKTSLRVLALNNSFVEK